MAFFPRAIYNNEASFSPLFRLLDEFDNYSRQEGGQGRRTAGPHWQPKFDVREVEGAYELHGELPGVAKEAISLEFPEPQTLVVRGKAERSYDAAGTPSAGAIESGNTAAEGQQQTVTTKSDQKQQSADKAKYWLSERSVGEFSRTFTFPSRVDTDSVSASLKDGIISVVVPKAKKPEARRVAIN